MPSEAPPSAPESAASVTPAQVATRLVGAWKPDIADVATDADLLRLPKPAQAEAIAAAMRILEQVGLEFGSDGGVTLRDGDVRRTGHFSVEGEVAGAWRVRASLAREEEAPQEEVLTVRFEGAALRIAGTDGKSRRFVRR